MTPLSFHLKNSEYNSEYNNNLDCFLGNHVCNFGGHVTFCCMCGFCGYWASQQCRDCSGTSRGGSADSEFPKTAYSPTQTMTHYPLQEPVPRENPSVVKQTKSGRASRPLLQPSQSKTVTRNLSHSNLQPLRQPI